MRFRVFLRDEWFSFRDDNVALQQKIKTYRRIKNCTRATTTEQMSFHRPNDAASGLCQEHTRRRLCPSRIGEEARRLHCCLNVLLHNRVQAFHNAMLDGLPPRTQFQELCHVRSHLGLAGRLLDWPGH